MLSHINQFWGWGISGYSQDLFLILFSGLTSDRDEGIIHMCQGLNLNQVHARQESTFCTLSGLWGVTH